MSYKHETTRRVESINFPGVVFFLKKMTEGRRIQLRSLLGEHNHRVREILKQQSALEAVPEAERDMPAWLDLQEEFDGIMIEKVNPVWINWGVKLIEGLESDGKPLTVDEWKEWPSALTNEVVEAVKAEAELNGTERKNFESHTTSGELVVLTPKSSTATSAEEKDSGETKTAASTSQSA